MEKAKLGRCIKGGKERRKEGGVDAKAAWNWIALVAFHRRKPR